MPSDAFCNALDKQDALSKALGKALSKALGKTLISWICKRLPNT